MHRALRVDKIRRNDWSKAASVQSEGRYPFDSPGQTAIRSSWWEVWIYCPQCQDLPLCVSKATTPWARRPRSGKFGARQRFDEPREEKRTKWLAKQTVAHGNLSLSGGFWDSRVLRQGLCFRLRATTTKVSTLALLSATAFVNGKTSRRARTFAV